MNDTSFNPIDYWYQKYLAEKAKVDALRQVIVQLKEELDTYNLLKNIDTI